ncbi:MAG TPA: cellulase family glycosylhydrolase [Streptosporangiaceae bacterium]
MTTAGWVPANRRLGWLAVLAGSVLMLAAVLAGSAAPVAGAASAPASPSCGRATGPFTVHGTKVLGGGGKAFVSYGTTVAGLQGPDWESSVNEDLQEIAATAADWCANTVRLQLSQDILVGPTGAVNASYQNAIQAEVSAAESDHLVVVLNDSTELTDPIWNEELGPTSGTVAFWKVLAGIYGNNPQVIFDLFNEPRMYASGMSSAQEWGLWLDGGRFAGVTYPFGMAQLAGYVRSTLHAKNLFWVEGPRYSVSFAGMVRWGAVLKVSGVVYAVHHPNPPHDRGGWYADFGYLVSQHIAPVVDGEWTNYEPVPTVTTTTVPTSCWADAPTTVPEYLVYLSSLGVGLNVYDLQPGYMIQSDDDLGAPTTIDAKTWSCQSASEPVPGQGAGSLVMTWFKQHNG